MRLSVQGRRVLLLAAGPLMAAGLTLAGPGRSGSESDLPADVKVLPWKHQDAVVETDGTLRPRWFGDQPIGICLDAPLERDTSRWQASLRLGDSRPGELRGPEAQAETTLCFQQVPSELASSRDLEVCATLYDAFAEREYRVPCFRAAYEADASVFEAEIARLSAVIGKTSEWTTERLISELERRGDELEERGYPFLAFRTRLVIVHERRNQGTSEAYADIRRRLSDLPAWLAQPQAKVPAMVLAHEHGRFELDQGRLRRAWEHLARAVELARSVAANDRIALVTRQADVLARMGAGREPIERLRAALDDCGRWPCKPMFVPDAHELLGWLLLIDPDSGPEELELAARSLEVSGETPTGDRREQANRWINLALLAGRQGRDPAPALNRARILLSELEPDARTRYYRTWLGVVEGLVAVAAPSTPESALEACREAASQAAFPRIAAWAWSCLGQAHRLRGEPELAARAFDQAILHHAIATADPGRNLTLQPGQWADDHYRAARLAVERGDAGLAWQLLENLDLLAVDVVAACEEEGDGARQQLVKRYRELVDELDRTRPPLAPERQRQLETVRRSLLRSLDEIQRALLAECGRPLRANPIPADLRAFALTDEIVLLGRRDDGEIVVHRRHAVSRIELRRELEALAEAQSRGRMDDEQWRTRTRPLAEALVPPAPEALGGVTRFALHGRLQQVPLSALPVETAGGTRWLGDLTVVVLRPAFVEEVARPSGDAGAAAPIFVVDPRRNLRSGSVARDAYRARFPEARVLYGPEATRAAALANLAEASFLHVDAHGRYDPAFPELSALLMYDGLLTLADFEGLELPRRFVNLAGCHTGSFVPTGDSGRYGLAGALARRVAGWVVASRSAIADHLGLDFNDVFYRELADGRDVPAAFAAALAAVSRRYPAAAWSNLVLLGTDSDVKSSAELTNTG